MLARHLFSKVSNVYLERARQPSLSCTWCSTCFGSSSARVRLAFKQPLNGLGDLPKIRLSKQNSPHSSCLGILEPSIRMRSSVQRSWTFRIMASMLVGSDLHTQSAMQNGSCDTKRPRAMSELEEFDEVFPLLVESLTKTGLKNPEIADAMEWFKEVCEYNVPFGKKNRGVSVVSSYRMLVENPKEEDLKTARILGWCVEWLQAYFLVADDIMDHSVTRRGQPCWYKKENVDLIAINDSFFLECAVYQILRNFIRRKPYYTQVLELFHETTLQTVTGQCLDLTTAPPEGKVDFSKFTLERYNAIVKWKTAFYSFYLPVALAMYMAGIDDDESHADAKGILLKMGEFFQIQDDYLDCYGAPEVIGKIGTDIQDNKCGWLVVQALSRALPSQRQVLQENYGRNDPDCIAKVKALYEEMGMSKLYKDYEEESYAELCTLINKTCDKLPKAVFHAFAQKIYKREK